MQFTVPVAAVKSMVSGILNLGQSEIAGPADRADTPHRVPSPAVP
jgi:hypothetical protein